jgi:hypothetical protein
MSYLASVRLRYFPVFDNERLITSRSRPVPADISPYSHPNSYTDALKEVREVSVEEVEKFFRCPYCRQKISMLLDLSTEGVQSYIEDCEVCCQPIQITYESNGSELLSFQRESC